MRRILLTLCLVVAVLALSGCWFKKKPKAQVPPAPPAQVPRAAQTNQPPTAAKKPLAKRKQVPSTPRAAQPAAPPRTAEVKKEIPAAKAELPQQFGKILSADEKSQYRAMYERSASAAREMLKSLTARELAGDAPASIGRIRSFLVQAQEAAATDWSTAAQLAYRAEVLARDLIRMLP
jgi:hypothetical protein